VQGHSGNEEGLEPQELFLSAKFACRAVSLTLSHSIVVVYRWIVDLYALEIEIDLVFRIKEPRGDIRYVLTSIALASDVNIISLHRE
jgi:hypothetical protein